MDFLNKKEKQKNKIFLQKGYVISKIEDKSSLKYISSLILKTAKQVLKKNNFSNLNKMHEEISAGELNDFRLNIINKINRDSLFRYHYFNIAKEALYTLAGNELMMQKSINLSIQFPNDNSSLLPIHSDVWSGDSPFEINLWVPLVNCYKTKSMYILDQKDYLNFKKKMQVRKYSSSEDIYRLVKDKVKWLKVNYGQFLIFNQALPHGNIVNIEKETRWSMNCRFKSFFSPYGDKKIGEFFLPITTRAMTEIGINFEYPFNKK
jgi:sporadic carbohydrate cluster 2OG-Fe(II) oxygenase